ncbi:hypothetical protein [Paenibacillus sp. PAMC21692]|uniref:hypothetical protein n=1 Tax=Paenibacillus sp. PAMC21692 TaxID=2762320 RepID=UPI00164DCDE9|nr:hypothetical protein [Paenibacillus sp. PAMC21692]QNK60367.1 hypothetical protein H7F31_16750 [Paenibacillus sp. PAMC21692]
MKRKRSRLEWLTIGVVVIVSVMYATVPSRERFDTFIAKRHGIECKPDFELGQVCYVDEKVILSKSGHSQRSFLHASSERDYKFENGEIITTRTLGLFGLLFEMRDGFWWEHVFN